MNRKTEIGFWLLAFSRWLRRFVLLFLIGLLISIEGFAQTDIPINTWRLHLSYNAIRNIAFSGDKVFAAAESGILVYDQTDESISSLNTLNALSATDITSLAFARDKNQLLVGYADGTLDIIFGTEVVNFTRLKTSPDITGSKRINHIQVLNNLAYLSTDYGVVVFDLTTLELRETWRDLSADGNTVNVFQSVVQGDTIFLATSNGILAGNVNTNLLDPGNWKYFDTGDFAAAVRSIALANSRIYAAINGTGIHHYDNGEWIMDSILPGETFYFLSGSANALLISSSSGVYRFVNDQLESLNNSAITSSVTIGADDQQNIWIGDTITGLLSNRSGNFEAYLPNGPTVKSGFKLVYSEQEGGTITALAGGYSTNGLPAGNQGVISQFQNGAWSNITTELKDLTDIEQVGSTMLLASFGNGLQQRMDEQVTTFDHTNSTLENSINGVLVSAVEESTEGLWVANYGASKPLHLLQNGTWSSFSIPVTAARYPTDLVVDLFGQVWMILDPLKGGGVLVYNREQNAISYRRDGDGNGGLLSASVNCAELDRDGYVWVGTDEGVAYFFSATSDAAKPIFENRFLLRDETITAIAVDGGNRKWIGTERGVWLFSSTGEELVYNFTAENSPLLSNVIQDIEINDRTGEVFFATDKGIISYRTDATASDFTFQEIKIFPNPVTSNFSGTVGINGLGTDAIVKITDVSGKLIWQTQANGGSASWNVRDYNGRRASTGIYLVFASSADGAEGVVGKIAVVD